MEEDIKSEREYSVADRSLKVYRQRYK